MVAWLHDCMVVRPFLWWILESICAFSFEFHGSLLAKCRQDIKWTLLVLADIMMTIGIHRAPVDKLLKFNSGRRCTRDPSSLITSCRNSLSPRGGENANTMLQEFPPETSFPDWWWWLSRRRCWIKMAARTTALVTLFCAVCSQVTRLTSSGY